jgi:hypothetical protein
MGKTLYDKLWDSHVIHVEADGTALYAAKAALVGRAADVWELVTDNFA